MRKVVSGLFVSLDGVVQAPNEWQFDHFDEGMMKSMMEQLGAGDTVLMGRTTYQEWAGYWPTATDEPFASFINGVPKYVASTTLDQVVWGKYDNVTLIKGSLADQLATLKSKPGKNILVTGSPTLVRSLIQNDQLDQLILMIHPVVVGKGKRLFAEGGPLKRLRLTATETTPTGVLIASYTRRDPK